MSRPMSDTEAREFLSAGTRTGKLAVVRRDGSPMVVPVWFAMDDDGTLVFTTWADSVKGRAMRRDPRVSLCVDREAPPFDYVRVDGTVGISVDPSELRTWATRIAARYMGTELADTYGRRNGVPGELLLRLTPTRVVAVSGVAD